MGEFSFAQFSPNIIRNGLIKAYSKETKRMISITYSNDTVIGPYYIKDLNSNIIIENGLFNNKYIHYINYEIDTICHNFPTYPNPSFSKNYNKNKIFKDTMEMLEYDLKHSLLLGKNYQYYQNGKVKSISNFCINEKNSYSFHCDTNSTYFSNGQLESFLIDSPNSTIEKKYFENGILRSKVLTVKDQNNEQLDVMYEDFYSSGKIKAHGYLFKRKKEGEEYFYYTNGNIQFIYIYEKDEPVLIKKYNKKGDLLTTTSPRMN